MAGISVAVNNPSTAFLLGRDAIIKAAFPTRVNVAAPAKATVKQTTNIAVWGGTVRITLSNLATNATAKMFAPPIVLLNSRMYFEDWRDLDPRGNYTARPRWVDPDITATVPSAQELALGMAAVPYIPGWTGRWNMDAWSDEDAQAPGQVGSEPFLALTPETANDEGHVRLLGLAEPGWRNQDMPRAFLRGGNNASKNNQWEVLSLDDVDPNEPNVDVRVKFRLWEPMEDLYTSWQYKYDANQDPIAQGIFPGHFSDSSNQFCLILGGSGGTRESNSHNVVNGYMLRNNWAEGSTFPTNWHVPSFGWELSRFTGIQREIEGQTATEAVESVVDMKYVYTDPGNPSGGTTQTIKQSASGAGHRLKGRRSVTEKMLRKFAQFIGEEETFFPLGEPSVHYVWNGWGWTWRPVGRYDGQPLVPNSAGDGLVAWSETGMSSGDRNGRAQGRWMWARMRKTVDGAKVRIQAKVWADGAAEPAAWAADVVDTDDLALQGGFVGFGSITPIHAEGGTMGQGLQVGPYDVGEFTAEVLEVAPGASVRFEAQVSQCLMEARTPDMINTGQLVRTWWDEYVLNSTPSDWYILRPGVGPQPDKKAIGSNDPGKPFPPDRLENFLVVQDPKLDPVTYPQDRSDRSLEHATRDYSVWIVQDETDDYGRYLDPNMPRDALAWNEPYPGTPWLGHDGQIDDAEVLIKVRADEFDQAIAVWLRASGAKGFENGYVVTSGHTQVLDPQDARQEVVAGAPVWTARKYVNGELGPVGQVLRVPTKVPRLDRFDFDSTEWFWVRVKIQGSSERPAARRAPREPTLTDQNIDFYPYGGVTISVTTWAEDEDEGDSDSWVWLDDGINFSPLINLPVETHLSPGFSGYRDDWDEWNEYINRPYDRYRPLIPPWDRGWFAVGGPSIGTKQNYAEIHVHSPRLPRLDSSAFEGIRNLLSEQAALGGEEQWTAENLEVVGQVEHEGLDGGRALEVRGTAASATGAQPRLISSERVPVSSDEAYVALATLDNFQHRWLPKYWLSNRDWFVDKYRRMRVGLRWYDASGNVLGTSMRTDWSSERHPGGPRFVGGGFHLPEEGYFEFGDPAGNERVYYDLDETDGMTDAYQGFAFPADMPQPFRWQERWRYQVHGGGRMSPNPDGRPEYPGVGWSLPMLHVAPEGAVEAAVVIELENAQNIESIAFEPVIQVDYLGAVPRVAPSQGSLGVRDERYRIGEIGVFPAFREPAYETQNVAPGQFALAPEEVTEHAFAEALEPSVHGHFSAQLDAPATATAQMFKPTTKATKPQFSRPQQDAHDGGWTKQDGSNELIWSAIDDLVPSDADYAQSQQMPDEDLYVAQLTRMTNPDPDSTEKYLVHVRYRRRGATPATLVVALYQGEVPIAEWEEVTDKTFATTVHELSPAQVASITDYADLRVRLIGDAVPV